METHVEFRSDRFPRYADESEGINPGRWGRRLAEFLQAGLTAKGFQVGEPNAEDWGWVVPIQNERFDVWVGCGNYGRYADGFLCFIEPHKPQIRKFFRKIDTRERVALLRNTIDELLRAEADIRDIRWWTREDFNQVRSPAHAKKGRG
jgi:hypothetical protein